MNEDDLRLRLQEVSATVAPTADPMPVLRRRRRIKRMSTGVVVAMLAATVLGAGRDGLRDALFGDSVVDPVAAATPLPLTEDLPAEEAGHKLIARRVGGPTDGTKAGLDFDARRGDLVRVVVRCQADGAVAWLTFRAAGGHDQRSRVLCPRAGDVLDVYPSWLWNPLWERETWVKVGVEVEAMLADGSPQQFGHGAEAAIGVYRVG